MRKILITGGAGNVGSALTDALLREPDTHVTVADNLSTGGLHKIPFANHPSFKFIKADVNDWEDISAIMLSNRFDYVFHYAAVVGVVRTLSNPIAVLKDIDGIRNILSLCKNTDVRRIFFSSSSEVYGEPVEFPQNEYTTPLNSKLPYAIVKNLAEAYLRSYYQQYGLSYTIFRFFNTYGPNQSTDFVVAKFLSLALNNDDITIYGDGNQTRTFCYIDDNIDVTIRCLNDGHAVNDILNIGNHIECSVIRLAQTIINITGSRSKITHLPPLQEGDMHRRQPDNSKMLQILGRPLIKLEEGLTKMLDYQLSKVFPQPVILQNFV